MSREVMQKYADVVQAYLDGAEVEFAHEDMPDKFIKTLDPSWSEGFIYRVKPAIVEKYIRVGYIGDEFGEAWHVNGVTSGVNNIPVQGMKELYPVIANIKMLCEKDTGKIISVELVD